MLSRFCLLLSALILCFYLTACSSDDNAPISKQEAKPSDIDEEPVVEDLSAILKSLEMSQGEGGFEVWRLKAEWANMQKDSGNILVEAPKLTYYMPPPDKGEIIITSKTGTINQTEQILRFVDEVEVNQDGSIVRGNTLIYNGTAKTMTFPEGGVFTGEKVSGEAPFLRWHMNESRIEATGGVDAVFESEKAPLGKK